MEKKCKVCKQPVESKIFPERDFHYLCILAEKQKGKTNGIDDKTKPDRKNTSVRRNKRD